MDDGWMSNFISAFEKGIFILISKTTAFACLLAYPYHTNILHTGDFSALLPHICLGFDISPIPIILFSWPARYI